MYAPKDKDLRPFFVTIINQIDLWDEVNFLISQLGASSYKYFGDMAIEDRPDEFLHKKLGQIYGDIPNIQSTPLLMATIKYFQEHSVYIPKMDKDFNYYLGDNKFNVVTYTRHLKMDAYQLFEQDLKDPSWLLKPPFEDKDHTYIYIRACGLLIKHNFSILQDLFIITIQNLPILDIPAGTILNQHYDLKTTPQVASSYQFHLGQTKRNYKMDFFLRWASQLYPVNVDSLLSDQLINIGAFKITADWIHKIAEFPSDNHEYHDLINNVAFMEMFPQWGFFPLEILNRLKGLRNLIYSLNKNDINELNKILFIHGDNHEDSYNNYNFSYLANEFLRTKIIDVKLVAQKIGMLIPPGFFTLNYYDQNYLYYFDWILYRPPVSAMSLDQLRKLPAFKFPEYLKYYKDDEIFSMAGAYYYYSSRESLIQNLRKYLENKGFFIPLNRKCKNPQTIYNLEETKDPNIFIVAYGTFSEYTCYEIDDLEGTFVEEQGYILFRIPEKRQFRFTYEEM